MNKLQQIHEGIFLSIKKDEINLTEFLEWLEAFKKDSISSFCSRGFDFDLVEELDLQDGN